MKNHTYENKGWQRGSKYQLGPKPTDYCYDWYKNGILIHDNGWGAIQILFHESELPNYSLAVMFACVEYACKFKAETKITKEQAFDLAIDMADGLIDRNVDLKSIIGGNSSNS